MFHKKTIKDIDIHDKTVLVRVDFNLPLDDHDQVSDTYRVEKAIPTIKYLVERNCKVALAAHFGRPKGKRDPKYSFEKVAPIVSDLLGQPVRFVSDCVGAVAKQAVKEMKPGEVVLLENTRFHPEEKAADEAWAKELVEPFDYFVQNAFGNAHREDASMVAAAHAKPAVAGFLLEEEVSTIIAALSNPMKPVVAVVGGAKIATKMDLLHNLIKVSDSMIVGGAMANTFLVALGHKVGKSLYDEAEVGQARAIREAAHNAGTELILPLKDVATATEVDATAHRQEKFLEHVQENDIILDFGAQSMRHVLEVIDNSATVLWNGPLGMTELPQFATSTEALAHHMVDHHVHSIVGGGDTASFVHELGIGEELTHVSTGGGASLELMSGKPLPGVEALLDK